MKMSEIERDALLSEVTAARERLLTAAEALPPEARAVPFVGVWDIQDLLAHFIGWDHANLDAIAELQRGELPGFYAHHDHDWRTYNAQLVARYRREDFAALAAEARESLARVVAAAAALPLEEFDRDRGVRYRRWKVTVARLLRAELRDEAEHSRQLAAFAASWDKGAG